MLCLPKHCKCLSEYHLPAHAPVRTPICLPSIRLDWHLLEWDHVQNEALRSQLLVCILTSFIDLEQGINTELPSSAHQETMTDVVAMDVDSAGPSTSVPEKKPKNKSSGKRFEIKKWNAVAMWSWAICTDTCAICRNNLYEPSIEYQVTSFSCCLLNHLSFRRVFLLSQLFLLQALS